MTSRTARVIAASNRAAAGVYEDTTGPVIVAWLRDRGYQVPEPIVVPDGDPVATALADAVASGVDVVLTTGGTGISPTDRTPEATRTVLDREVPGVADAVRAAGLPKVPTAVLSRGVAGVAGRTFVVNLPGSTGGVRDGLGVLAGLLDHAVDQIAGGDHARPDEPHGHSHGHSPGHVRSHSRSHGPVATVPAAVVEAARSAGPVTVRVLRTDVTEEPLSVEEHAALVGDAATGAVVTFAGVVRDHDHGRGVRDLEYVGHPTAKDVVAEVVTELAARYAPDGVRAIAVSHRVGRLAVGDVALAVAVAAEHRREAFTACADVVDEVKLRLPVWKRQTFTDGTEEWVNCP
jgi:molybdenum cofactor synthesis domain-containing protein